MFQNLMNSPRYQRALKRYQRLSPEEQAVFNPSNLLTSFQREEANRNLAYMGLAERKASRLQNKELAEKRLAIGQGGLNLQKKALGFERRRARAAEPLAWANVGLSGMAGWMNIRQKQKWSQQLQDLISLYRTDTMAS